MIKVLLLKIFHFLLSISFIWTYFILPYNYYLLVNILVFFMVLAGYTIYNDKCVLVLLEYEMQNKEYKSLNDGFIYRTLKTFGITVNPEILKKIMKLFLIFMLMIYCYNYGLLDAGTNKTIFSI